jgi:putative transposase
MHKKGFLLKFAKDRQRWVYWLFETRKRYGLCILIYIVLSKLDGEPLRQL